MPALPFIPWPSSKDTCPTSSRSIFNAIICEWAQPIKSGCPWMRSGPSVGMAGSMQAVVSTRTTVTNALIWPLMDAAMSSKLDVLLNDILIDNNTDVEKASISSMDNYIIFMDISQPGDMAEIGQIPIGEPHEVITAVKFGETFSYAMTFDQVS